MTNFKFTKVWSAPNWRNYHHSLPARNVASWLVPEVEAVGPPPMTQHGAALQSILEHCFATGQRLSIPGANWSLSNAFDPGNIVLDPGAFNQVFRLDPSWIDGYKSSGRAGDPVFVGGGARVSKINDDLGRMKLALPTSGAADGQRMAGCVGTGTHGADINVGAVHDMIIAVCLMTAPNQMIVIQPSSAWIDAEFGAWLQKSTLIPTETRSDDNLFQAAQVALGGLGVVYGLVIEAVPLYEIVGMEYGRPLFDQDIWEFIRTLDPSALGGPAHPDILALMTFPYATDQQMGAVASVYKKQAPTRPYQAPVHATSLIATDTSKLVAMMTHLDNAITSPLIGQIVTSISQSAYKPGPVGPLFPGEMFGPTTLPPGNGVSTEIAVAHAQAVDTLKTILGVLASEAAHGRHHLGVAGVRFVKGSHAHLAMNRSNITMFVELAGLQTPFAAAIQQAVWSALASAGINYTCHWGQQYGVDPGRIAGYYGAGITKWQAARNQLLPTSQAKSVFKTPLLEQLQLV